MGSVGLWEGLFTWGLPVVLAITLHEAAHGFVANLFGDPTAKLLGRVTINPLKHIDPLGTILIPLFLFLSGASFLFGYAKPVPVYFARLNPFRLGIALVALAGPLTNVGLAFISALLLHTVPFIPPEGQALYQTLLIHSVSINGVLAVFNMLPILPLDGGRVLFAVLPAGWGFHYARFEPLGMPILLLIMMLPNITSLLFHKPIPLLTWLIETPYEILVSTIGVRAGIPF